MCVLKYSLIIQYRIEICGATKIPSVLSAVRRFLRPNDFYSPQCAIMNTFSRTKVCCFSKDHQLLGSLSAAAIAFVWQVFEWKMCVWGSFNDFKNSLCSLIQSSSTSTSPSSSPTFSQLASCSLIPIWFLSGHSKQTGGSGSLYGSLISDYIYVYTSFEWALIIRNFGSRLELQQHFKFKLWSGSLSLTSTW